MRTSFFFLYFFINSFFFSFLSFFLSFVIINDICLFIRKVFCIYFFILQFDIIHFKWWLFYSIFIQRYLWLNYSMCTVELIFFDNSLTKKNVTWSYIRNFWLIGSIFLRHLVYFDRKWLCKFNFYEQLRKYWIEKKKFVSLEYQQYTAFDYINGIKCFLDGFFERRKFLWIWWDRVLCRYRGKNLVCWKGCMFRVKYHLRVLWGMM